MKLKRRRDDNYQSIVSALRRTVSNIIMSLAAILDALDRLQRPAYSI